MAWDSQNRIVSCVLNGATSAFTYGADGLRRSQSTGGTTTDYAYDGQSMVRELQMGTGGALVPTATYLTGPTGPEYRRDDTQTETDGQGHTFGKTRWYVYDGLGSVVGEVDPLGNLTCANEYDVYGNVRSRVGTASTAHGFVGSLGHLSDASTGLIYMRARYYDPGTGRFASEDPKGVGVNFYIYCNDDPINVVDQSGESPALVAMDCLSIAATGCVLYAVMGTSRDISGYAAAAYWGNAGALLFAMAYTCTDPSMYSSMAMYIIPTLQLAYGKMITTMLYETKTVDEEGAAGSIAAVAVTAACVEGIAVCGAMASIGADATG